MLSFVPLQAEMAIWSTLGVLSYLIPVLFLLLIWRDTRRSADALERIAEDVEDLPDTGD